MLQRRGQMLQRQNQHLQHQQQQQPPQQPTQHRQFPLMPPSSIYAQCSAVADGSSGGVGSGAQNSYAPAVLPSSNQTAPDFIYWQPPPQQQQLQRDQIMVEQQQQQSGHVYGLPQQARPRMGLGPRMAPIHTSTPHLLPVIAASPLRTTENNGEDDEEPIYCEIARDSPEKTARLPTPAKNARSSAFLRRQQQVGVRRDVVTRRQAGDFTEVRVDNRKSCDFSPSPKRYQHLPPSARPLAPTKSGQISYRPGGGSGAMESDLLRGRLQLHPYSPPPLPLPTHGGLGRRAVTQLDFGRTQRNNPNNFAAAAAMAAPRLMQQQQQYHGGSQYLNKRGGGGARFAAAAAGEGGLMVGPYSSDSEFTAQRARRPHVLLHKEQPMMRMRRPSQKASSDFCGNASDCGFGSSALDDTTSTAPTDLSVATSATGAHSTTSSLRNAATLRKGLMWQQRDKMFSRWKERFFILTSNYLQCFKKGTSRITEMGGFIFKLRLSEVEEVELIDKKGYLTISLSLVKEGKILLRKPEGIREWFQDLKDSVASCREKRSFMMPTKEFWSKKQFTDSSSMEQWILARRNIQAKYAYNGEAAAGDDAQSLRHLKDVSKSNLNVARKNPVMTTDYGFIDMPPLPPSSQNCHGRGGEHEAEGGAAGNNLGDKSRIAADEDMIAGLTLDDTPSEASRSSVSPISSDFPMKNTSAVQCRIPKDSSSTFSHDSGVDSMNTNSSGSVLSSASNRPTPSMVAYRGSSAPSAATPVTANSKFGARNNAQRSNFRQNSAPPMAGGARRPSKLPKPVSTPGKAENPKQHHISVV